MISCLSFEYNLLKKKNKHNIIFYVTIHVYQGYPQLIPDPPSPKQTSLSEWKPQNKTNTHKPPPPNPISTMTPTLLMRSTSTQNKIPLWVPHSRKESEPMSHDDCACCVARCSFRCSLKLWSVRAILISLGISFHILLPANAIVFWKFCFPLGWINYYYWQI